MQLVWPRRAYPPAARLIPQRSGRRTRIRSYASKETQHQHVSGGDTTQQLPLTSKLPVPEDPRPRWMFSTAALLRITLIPVGLLYAVFYHDFGEEEHVFMPPRRWLQRQKKSLFTLSPAEKGLVKDVEVTNK